MKTYDQLERKTEAEGAAKQAMAEAAKLEHMDKALKCGK
jgi:hypothetical protein